MAKMTVLAVAVLCGGRLFPEDTPIEHIPSGNRESVRLRYSKEIDVPDRPRAAATKKVSQTEETQPPTPPAPPAAPPAPSTPPEPEPATIEPEPESSTPLPTMAEELLVLLKAGGIETVEQAKDYFTKNKSFRALKGVGEAKDLEIRVALDL